jgi:uroporphyrinogen decarboxylase
MQKNAIQKLRSFYARETNAPFVQSEFGFYSLEAWKDQGMPQDVSKEELFGFDAPARYDLKGLGWCEAAFEPLFESKVISDRGEHEIVQDFAGRHVLYFKNRRSGFMPSYEDHPVKDLKTWKENCEWRLDPETAIRTKNIKKQIAEAKQAADEGKIIVQQVIGGYMYLRSLIGPEDLLYKFYDDPELIHACMKSWFTLADHIISEHQKELTLDEIFFGEDICYNNGSLISPEMIREFLFPYYQQLINNTRKRQIDKGRHLFFQLDTDGWAAPVIDLYKELGMDYMSPFEVASGCDVVEIRRKYPDLLMRGGFDKRILAKGKDAIDREVDRIFPFMHKHGGYIPQCDHGVPAEVHYEDYLHFRKRCREFG